VIARGHLALAFLALGAAAAPRVWSQQPNAAPVHRVEGRVLSPKGSEAAPLAGVMVTIHRVNRAGGQPLDSVRTGADGRYAFRYRPSDDTTSIYFVSASYADIAYFSPPLRAAVVKGDAADIIVFDTTSAAVPIHQRGRHIVVSALDSNRRRGIIEVYELSNDSSVTRIARDTAVVWDAGLPSGMTRFQVGEGDVSTDAVTASDGRVRVVAPLAPGIKQLSFSYDLDAKSFPLSVPAERETSVLEVLIEDPQGTATGGGIAEVDPVDVEGRTFRRFLAHDVPASSVIRIDVPRGSPVGRGRYIAIVALALLAAMLVVLARAVSRRGGPRREVQQIPEWANDPDRLARRIAALDAEFERIAEPSEETRATYEIKRGELKSRLADALSKRVASRSRSE
jgi:hypothetical protein